MKGCIQGVEGWVDTRHSTMPEEDAEEPAIEASEGPAEPAIAEWPFGLSVYRSDLPSTLYSDR